MLFKPYELVWDCCCDHGLLGMSLLDTAHARKLVFVDVLANQMRKLESSLREDFPLAKYNWHVRCGDVRNIVVPKLILSCSSLLVLAEIRQLILSIV